MSSIETLLENIMTAVYGEEVRSSIHDAIEKCYENVSSASLREAAFQSALQAAIAHGDIPGMVIADNSVSGAKIIDGTLPLSKLAEPVQITIDSALSGSSTNPVQNKVIKSALDEINGSLNTVRNLTYTDYAEMSVHSTDSGYKLKGDGGRDAGTGCEIRKYAVTPGDIMHLVLSDDTTYTYQWSKGTTVNASNLVGTPIQGTVDDYVIVPKYATYLFVSCLMVNTSNRIVKSSRNTFSNEALYALFSLLDSGAYSKDVRVYIQSLKKILGYIDKTESRTLLRDWQLDSENPLTSKDASATTITATSNVSFSEDGATLPAINTGAGNNFSGIKLITNETGITLNNVSVVIDFGKIHGSFDDVNYYKLLCTPESSGTTRMFGYYYGEWQVRDNAIVYDTIDIHDPGIVEDTQVEIRFGSGDNVSIYFDGMPVINNADGLHKNDGLHIGANRGYVFPITVKRIRIYQD